MYRNKQPKNTFQTTEHDMPQNVQRAASGSEEDSDVEEDIILPDSGSEQNEVSASVSNEEPSGKEDRSSILRCCGRLFCCGQCSQPSKPVIAMDPASRAQARILHRKNCKRENGFNKWSAFSALPVNAAGVLVDKTFSQENNSAPVFAFVTGMRSLLAIAVNAYFLCHDGTHSTGSKWSLGANIVTLVLSILLFGNSLALLGIEAEHEEEATVLMFLTVMQYCLLAGIPVFQSGELGYFSLKQIEDLEPERVDEEMGLASLRH